MRCEMCGNKFDKEEAQEEFETEMPSKSYEHFEKNLCGKCAINAIQDLVSGIYFEYCDRCSKKYDPIEDESKFQSIHSNDYGTYASISDLTNGELLCLDCAIEEYNNN